MPLAPTGQPGPRRAVRRARSWGAVVASAVMLAAVGCSSASSTSSATGTSAASTGHTTTTRAPHRSGPSAGCKTLSKVKPGEQEIHVTVDGVDRWYLRNVPTSYDGHTPMPVVMDLHGFGEGAKLQTMISGMGAYGDAHGFITLTPNGQGTPVYWNATLGSPDLRFLGDLVNQAEAQLCVDQARVYVTGYSNGAYMTSSMACQFANRIAAVAPVAGLTDTEGCHPGRPVPVMAFHGTGDQFVPYDGGVGPKGATLQLPDGSGRTIGQADPDSALMKALVPGGMKPIEDNAEAWASRNGCHPTPTVTRAALDVTLQTFPCPPDGAVELYVVAGGGHAWPGSAMSAKLASVTGRTTMSIDATDLMWQFFVAHPMPAS